MALVIVRTSKINGRSKRQILPGAYGDKSSAERIAKQLVEGYAQHGIIIEGCFWWTRNKEGRQFKFEICGVPTHPENPD
jgi:hypothetical protein